jgi:hypothetical protein
MTTMPSRTSIDRLITITHDGYEREYLLSIDGPEVYLTEASGYSRDYEELPPPVQSQLDRILMDIDNEEDPIEP